MKSGAVLLATVGLVGISSVALAETPPPRVGFQMDIRTGYALPMGTFAENVKMSDIASGQVPFIVDIGGKVIPELFIGGYLGLAFGGAGGRQKDLCDNSDLDCTVFDIHFGAEAQYHILPGGPVNPWIGYGLGYESLGMSVSRNGTTTSSSVGGFEFARFMGGVDFRVTRVFGVGPFVDLSMATFSTASNGATITEKGTHEWLTLGVRFVFFP